MERLKVKQAAKLLGCHEQTVRNLEAAGKIRAFRDYRGYRVFSLDEILKLKEQREALNAAPLDKGSNTTDNHF